MKFDKKRVLLLFILSFMILLLGLVSARTYYSSYSGGGFYSVIYWFQDNVGSVFAIFLGGTGDFLFERILLLFVMVSVIFVILSRIKMFKDNLAVMWIVTLAVSLLSTRFLADTEFMINVLTPYSVLGVALSAGIPLLIYIFFVQSFESGVVRRVLWIFFLVVFAGIWYSRYGELGDVSWIYFITGVIALIFFLADGTIRRVMIKEEMRQMGYDNQEKYSRDIRREIDQARKDLDHDIITEGHYNRLVRKLRSKLKAISRH